MQNNQIDFKINRLPKNLQSKFLELYSTPRENLDQDFLEIDHVHTGDARQLLPKIEPNSIALSVWSPPYFVGKDYETGLTFNDWKELLACVIQLHYPIIKPGGFLVINIADILVFKDTLMPRIQADVIHRKRSSVTKDEIIKVQIEHPSFNRNQLAHYFGCSEQTIDRRLNGNNIRGGKSESQTRVKIVGGLIEQWALDAGFYPYDRRIWVKDAAWENSRWASLSYRAVDEFEYIYIFWKPGITKYDRNRLTKNDWRDWGSRAVWYFPSVRINDDHEAKFPLELPLRIIRLLSDPEETVLDCFMGSGTTAIAAIKEKRRFIGIELLPKYVELSNNRIIKESKSEHAH
jgi:DNA modification methylase